MKEDIIRMAREAGGIRYTEKDDNGTGMFATFDMVKFGIPMLERFFHMAQAAEREACAELAREILEQCEAYDFGVPAAIRARGQA
jgi:hypothetical protein